MAAAITAPWRLLLSAVRPNRWAPNSANIGLQDRGAALRVCPIFGQPVTDRFNVEYRVADATACPTWRWARWSGPGSTGCGAARLPPFGERDFWELERGRASRRRLRAAAAFAGEALELLAGSAVARDWFGDELFEAYLMFKRSELKAVEGMTPAEICAKYAEVY